MRRMTVRYLLSDSAAALAEYAFIAAVLGVGLVAAFSLIGAAASTQLGTAQSNLTNASNLTGNSLP